MNGFGVGSDGFDFDMIRATFLEVGNPSKSYLGFSAYEIFEKISLSLFKG